MSRAAGLAEGVEDEADSEIERSEAEQCYQIAGGAKLFGRLSVFSSAQDIGHFLGSCKWWRFCQRLCFEH